MIVSNKIVDVLGKLLSLLDARGKFYVYEEMKNEMRFYFNDRTLLIVLPKLVKRKSLFIGYTIDRVVIPNNIKDLDNKDTLERYLFPVMNVRKGTEIIYL